MRIAYLINQYPMVSHTFIRREILAIERQGFEVVRISMSGWKAQLPDPQDQLERKHTRYIAREGVLKLLVATMRMAIVNPLRFFRALALTFKISARSERSLLSHFGYFAEACLLQPLLRRKGVQHLHAHFSTNSAEVAMYVYHLGGPQWSFTVHGLATLENPKFVGIQEKVARCSFVVAVCSFARGQLMRFADLRYWPKIHVVHCGLEHEYFDTQERPAVTSRRLVCVGRLCNEKAQMLLVEAAHLISQRGIVFELVLAGDGELRPEIEALIARCGLGDRVRVTGWLSGEQVRKELLAARALVLPSFAEGLPVVIMEAMALRRPIISTYVAGIPELVNSGEHGWLVPSGDVDSLVQAITECLAAPPELLMRMGEAAHERVLARHDIDVEATKLAKLIRNAVEAKSAQT